jgi:hypothetical protein
MPPAVSERQRKFMAICSHEPGKAKGKCPSKKVAREFSKKPKGGYDKRKVKFY